jgi:hypothetical protein
MASIIVARDIADTISIADKFGRKYAFYTLWIALVAAVALESFGRVWQTWLVAKLFSGFGLSRRFSPRRTMADSQAWARSSL